jgi:hypothetical protein
VKGEQAKKLIIVIVGQARRILGAGVLAFLVYKSGRTFFVNKSRISV